MWVRGLSLVDFRNFTSLQTPLINGTNIIYGDNAQGKTNFLEALYFCATGRSQRAGSDRELIRFGAREAWLGADIERLGSPRKINAQLRLSDKKTIKSIAVDHVPIRKLNELFGTLLAVVFSPEDLNLIKAGPAERRGFVDRELSQINPVYYHELRQYHLALKQRNNLLKTLQTNRTLTETLFIWDEQLCQYGLRIMAFREAFLQRAGELASDIHRSITGGLESLGMSYRPNIANPDDYAEKLRRHQQRDIMLGSTNFGVHRDDIYITVNGADARTYGSQGQQRTAALSVKLAEIAIMTEEAGVPPILLLDDVLSELDEHRQNFLFGQIGALQTVITCTGVEDLLRKNCLQANVKVMRMASGVLETEG